MKKTLILLMIIITVPLLAQDITNKLGGKTAAETYDVIDSDSALLFRVQGDGNVGIGTTSPSVKLDVNGPIKGTGLSINGPVVGSGFANWDTNSSDDLTTSTTFGGDVSGIYNAIAVGNDSHTHTAATVPVPALGDLNAGPPYLANTYYTAATDGFIFVQAQINPTVTGGFFGYLKSGTSSPISVAKVSGEDSANISMMFACKKGDQWSVSGSELRPGFTKIYWMPFGT